MLSWTLLGEILEEYELAVRRRSPCSETGQVQGYHLLRPWLSAFMPLHDCHSVGSPSKFHRIPLNRSYDEQSSADSRVRHGRTDRLLTAPSIAILPLRVALASMW
ncbi:hypothetical protein DENSPDRAFT_691319 [Dentipellis sp. KUC8613]|nr:hypothetical protein DENSPDRAFT_691319 [Dentipellis sp. KUC8613]